MMMVVTPGCRDGWKGLKRGRSVKRAGQKGLKWGLSSSALGNEETMGFKRIHRDFTGRHWCHSLHLHMNSAHTNTQMHKQTHKHIKYTHTQAQTKTPETHTDTHPCRHTDKVNSCNEETLVWQKKPHNNVYHRTCMALCHNFTVSGCQCQLSEALKNYFKSSH